MARILQRPRRGDEPVTTDPESGASLVGPAHRHSGGRALHMPLRRSDARRHRSERLLAAATASSTPSSRWPASSAGRSATRPATRSADWSTSWRGGPTGRPTLRSAGWWCGSAVGWPSWTPSAIDRLEHAEVVLRSARLDLRDFSRRPGEVMLGQATCSTTSWSTSTTCRSSGRPTCTWRPVLGRVRLVGVDVATPRCCAGSGPGGGAAARPPTGSSTGPPSSRSGTTGRQGAPEVRLRTTHEGLHRLRPGELADLLEDLRRPERQELLAALSARRGGRRPRGDGARGPRPSCCASPSPTRRPTCCRPWSPTRRSTPSATCRRGRAGGPAGPHAGRPRRPT